MADRFGTGTQSLDRELGGGFAPGTLVTYVAPPQVQAETVLTQLAAQRATRYVTTVTPPWKVEETVADLDGEDCTVTTFKRGNSLSGLRDELDIEEESYVVLDAVDALEHADPDAYHEFLGWFADALSEANAVGVCHAIDGHDVAGTRDWTLRAADVVLRLAVTYDGIEPETLLRVEKTRGTTPPDEALKLHLGRTVEIDTSWDM